MQPMHKVVLKPAVDKLFAQVGALDKAGDMRAVAAILREKA